MMPSAVPHVNTPLRLRKNEARLREGQCGDAIVTIRRRLIAKTVFINYRNAHVTGQKGTTRAATMIATLSQRVRDAAAVYRESRAALIALVGVEGCGVYRELKDEDLRIFDVGEEDAAGVTRLNSLGRRSTGTTTGSTRRDQPGSSKRLVPWYWLVKGAPNPQDDRYNHNGMLFSFLDAHVGLIHRQQSVRNGARREHVVYAGARRSSS